MENVNFFEHVIVDDYSATPKYLQLSNAIISAIKAKKFHKNYLLPSINDLSKELEISRDTAEKGYKNLKKLGVLGSIPGKGYYILDDNFSQKLKIFLLFNKLSVHKKIIYDSFVNSLGDDVGIDFFIYNNDFLIFKKFLERRSDDYSHFVIIPHFFEEDVNVQAIINAIPKHKLLLLDKNIPGIDGEYAAVYENFKKDIYGALEDALPELSKYQTIKLIFPEKSYYPEDIIKGFQLFCQQYAFAHFIIHDVAKEIIQIGEVYLVLMEEDLLTLIERLIGEKLEVGKDVGVISYNETPIKKIILNGITTISTNFKFMGEMAAKLIMQNSKEHIPVPFTFIKRASL